MLSENESKKVQVLRGVAIIAVVMIHNMNYGPEQIVLRPFMNFAVGLFLFLSGMLSDANHWHPIKRIVKIIIPYCIWTVGYTIAANLSTPALIPIKVLKGLLLGNAAAIMYYVFVYCELTLLIPLIDKLSKTKYYWTGFLISPIAVILFRTIPSVIGIDFSATIEAIRNISCLDWFSFFYLGYILGNHKKVIDLKLRTLIPITGCCILLEIVEGGLFYTIGVPNSGTQLKVSALLTATCFILLGYKYLYSNTYFMPKSLALIGDYSFGIYFAHLGINRLLMSVPNNTISNIFPLNAIVNLFATIVFVLICHNLLGKYARYIAC